MKSIFPKAEETVILDVLTSSDNNIQKASEWLKKMGYERKDPIKLQQQVEIKSEEQQKAETQLNTEAQVPKIKTADEKAASKYEIDVRNSPSYFFEISVVFYKDKLQL